MKEPDLNKIRQAGINGSKAGEKLAKVAKQAGYSLQKLAESLNELKKVNYKSHLRVSSRVIK